MLAGLLGKFGACFGNRSKFNDYGAFMVHNANLLAFLESAGELVCRRCNRQDVDAIFQGPFRDAEHWPEQVKWVHNDGGVMNFLTPARPLSSESMQKFIDDTEHGIFHGFCVAFVAFLLAQKTEEEKPGTPPPVFERLMASCVLHDVLKCADFKQGEHDRNLVSFFPDLLPETYVHSNPPDKENSYLICADRMELRRYSDYRSWIDRRFDELLERLSPEIQTELDIFYRHTRPALRAMWQHQSEIWLRYGPEKPYEERAAWSESQVFPPCDSWWQDESVGISDHAYCVEHDRFPFSPSRLVNKDSNLMQGFCASHDRHDNWNRCKGFIPFSSFLGHGGKILKSGKRDHLYAVSEIPLSQWLFVISDVDDRADEMNELLACNTRGVVTQDVVSQFHISLKLWTDRLLVLNGSRASETGMECGGSVVGAHGITERKNMAA